MSLQSNFDSVELHIEELILHGFPQGNYAEIVHHVEQELTDLIQQRGLPSGLLQGGYQSHLKGGAFNVAPNASPRAVAAQVAQTLYQGLVR